MAISGTPTWELNVSDAFPSLKDSIETDVVVAGGGLCGILTAYLLLKSGKQVVVLEQDSIGSGATLYTTAFITQDIDTDITDLEFMLGSQDAKKVWDCGRAAIDQFEKIILEEKIECEFERVSYYTLAFSVEERKKIYEMKEVLNRWGVESEILENPDLGFTNYGCLRLANQAKFHPIKFLRGLTLKIEEMGGRIFEGSKVTELKSDDSFVTAYTDQGQVRAARAVVATYQPLEHPVQIKFKKGYYETYMMEAEVKKGILKNGMYVDMKNPYYYFRVDPKENFDRVILGGEDHRKELKIDHDKSYDGLKKYLSNLVGENNFQVTRLWDGSILEPSDGLPLIGEYEKNKYIGTAFSGTGMTYSMISGMLITDLILGKANDWTDVYNPKRIPSLKQLIIKGRDYMGVMGNALGKIFRNSNNKSMYKI